MRVVIAGMVGTGVVWVLVDDRMAILVGLTLVLVGWSRRWGRQIHARASEPVLLDGYDTDRENLSREYKRAIFERDGNVCRYGCLPTLRNPLEVDHHWPVRYGGTNRPVNLQTLCKYHNRLKGSKAPAPETVAPGEPVWRYYGSPTER